MKDSQKSIKIAFTKIKQEFDVHLDSINQNTSEIQTLGNYIAEIDEKINKLNERLDEVQLYLSPHIVEDQFAVDLTHREQEVFVVLYAQENAVTAKEMARRLGFTDEMVNKYIYNMITKGIPILKQFENEKTYLHLDLKFKDLQARKNVLNINESISKQLLTDRAL